MISFNDPIVLVAFLDWSFNSCSTDSLKSMFNLSSSPRRAGFFYESFVPSISFYLSNRLVKFLISTSWEALYSFNPRFAASNSTYLFWISITLLKPNTDWLGLFKFKVWSRLPRDCHVACIFMFWVSPSPARLLNVFVCCKVLPCKVFPNGCYVISF